MPSMWTAPSDLDYYDQPEEPETAVERDPEPPNDPIYEARSHLGAALMQTIPSDDEIIMEHVRAAHALLSEEWRARREVA